MRTSSCFLSLSDTPEEEYRFSGGQTLSLVLGELPTTVNGTFSSDGSIFINIAIDFNGIPVDVTFNGTKLTGNESSEALITSFTFDASNSANAAVHSTTIDQENHTISVITTQEGGDLTALVPTIEISAEASISPASGESINLSNGQTATYTVTAEDGTENIYTVLVYGRAAYFYDFETWEAGTMYDDILNPAGWATCNDAVALIKNMGYSRTPH